MKQLAQQLYISIMPKEAEPEAFNIKIVSGISPCKAGLWERFIIQKT
jgi:hypothetical protein